jgi:hypothetical protein
MGSKNGQDLETQHAFLVAWGQFAQEIGLVEAIQAVSLKQKAYRHRPETKVLEFLVALMSGLRQLQEISLAAHPLDKDQAVAQAWGQPGWADYTGISRTLSRLSWEEVHHLVAALEEVSQPFVVQEIRAVRRKGERLTLDADLTGLPVSNTSTSYPNAAFGHMDTEIRLGYQAGVVSLVSLTYGRLWLSVAHHPGDTVSSTQAENLVAEAERRLGLHPRRRTELLRERIVTLEKAGQPAQERLAKQGDALDRAEKRLAQTVQQRQERQAVVRDLEHIYQTRGRLERPTSKLALARKRLQACERRLESRRGQFLLAQGRLQRTQARLVTHQAEIDRLQQRLERFEQDNAAHPDLPEIVFRLDAGFGTYENVALLIEPGYEVYTKPQNHKVVDYLRRQTDEETAWTQVGANAEMTAWRDFQLPHCAYPLNIGLECFHTGQKLRHSALFHFGREPVTQDLPAWFAHYNGRQTIEAGIKEAKQVFYLHRIKVRAEPAIFLQEAFVTFAANFIRWAGHWMHTQGEPVENALPIEKLGIKRQVQVGAHVSARVVRNADGMLLMFSPHSSFAGKVLALKTACLFGDQSGPQFQLKFFEVLRRFLPNRI